MVHNAKDRSRARRILVSVAAAAAMLLMANAASAAAAEAPRWVLNTMASPTHIVPGSPRNEVQALTVTATGGTYKLVYRGGETPTATSPISYDATAAEVKEALGKVSGVGRFGVEVTEAPGGGFPYDITFKGFTLGDKPVPMLGVQSSELTGGSAKISLVTRGAQAPELTITATNVGGAATDGSTITLKDVVPSWLKVTGLFGYDAYSVGEMAVFFGHPSEGTPDMSCTMATLTCTYSKPVDPGDQLVMEIHLAAETSGSVMPNTVAISGGGAAAASAEAPLELSETQAGHGVAPSSVFTAISSHEAGAHPNVTASFGIATEEVDTPAGSNPKDVRFDLPPGLVGSTVGMPRCSMSGVREGTCPTDTMVGMETVVIALKLGINFARVRAVAPVYNLAPSPGEPAAFGFNAVIVPVRFDTSVLSDGNYGVRVTASDLSEAAGIIASSTTLWGVPADHAGPGSNGDTTWNKIARVAFGGPAPGQSRVPLLTNPQQCTSPLSATMSTDAWIQPGAYQDVTAPMGTLTGCDLVPFASSFSFLPDTLRAAAPAGYTFDLNVPQQNAAGALASSSVKKVKLTLPEGVVVNPSAAWGLKACTNAQFYGPHHPFQQPAPEAACPRESQVGEVEVETPDLQHVLKGQVFLASPECAGPCTAQEAEEGKMVRLFVQLVGEGEAGIIVKLEGHGEINRRTGQITTVFDQTPQVPFNRMKLVLEGGPRAVLANPRKCGMVRATGDLTPWNSELAPGEKGLVGDSTPFYEFEIKQNCFGPQFKPSFSAGMPNVQAGADSEFTLSFGRSDKDQFLKQITLKMPPGLLGTLRGVPLCGQAQANAGTCGTGSLIGEAQVLTGPGADPFLVEGGKVYLTQGYGGSQFGLSIVVPAVAGPYTLAGTTGHGTVVVRSQLFIDPHTAQITAVSGPMPSMLDGIPLQLRAVDVKLNRPGFMFNPTSCAKMAITGSIASQEGMAANVSEPFQVTNCARLPFHPTLTALTHAHHSKKEGAYLHVVVKSGPGQANLRYVKVELPEALPSVLKTLQHACTEEQFAANPAGCPAESIVGHASAVTPVLPVPLTGPAYFVSHAGKHFPELVVVLQGYGITVDLNGETFISKAEVTSSTFKTVPDVPVSRFDLVLPQRAYPALDATTNFCKHPQVMPTRIVGQNGKVIERKTKIKVTGCGTFIAVRGKHVHGEKATILVHTSGAGKLIANGKGISRKVKRVSKKGGRVGITVRLTRHLRRELRRGHRHHMKVRVHLTFKARHSKGKGKAVVTVKLK